MTDDLISRQAAIYAIWNIEQHGVKITAKYNRRLKRLVKIINAVAKLPSAGPKWIPFTKRELTTEEQEEHPEWCYIMECPCPEEDQEILVSNGKRVWLDTFCVDDGCYLDSDHELEGCAWMPLPEPWKGEV